MAVNPGGPYVYYCEAPGCLEWGTYGFKWAGAQKWACLAHRARGAAWLEKMKSAGTAAPQADSVPPAQGVLL